MRDSFIFYRSYADQLRKLPDKQFSKVMKAIFDYALDGTITEMGTIEEVIFGLIRPQIDANNVRYENGCKGGRPKKTEEEPNNNQPETNPKPTKNQPETNPKPNENVNENVNVNKKEIGTNVPTKKETERTDERSEKQREFFETYPNIVIDNYSAGDYADIDFEVLLQEFALSKKILQPKRSFKWICSHWAEISKGCYRDWETPKPTRELKPIGSEWDGIE